MRTIDAIEKQYTQSDFLNGTEPYEYVYQYKDDPFTMQRVLAQMCIVASNLKIRNFKKLFGEYVAAQRKANNTIYADNVTQFDNQEIELNCGQWQADELGISIITPFGEVFACNHPILPVMRLINIDTGIEKVQLAYRKGRQWRKIIAERKVIASNNSIVGLADYGIGVNSENSKYLVRYLHDVEHLNFELIPEKNSVSRLGWIDGEGFSPYVGDLVFDGDISYKTYFESVQEHGKFDAWIDVAKKIRQGGIYARVILASAFSSALVQPLGCLPFFVHLWGGTEVGKTVGLMLATSVWANPEMGKYIHTFNSTNVGREKSAGFVNSLPLVFDELQIIADKKSFDNEIYMLSEGIGRSRGAKTGGIQRLETWRNCILTSGEMPITTMSSGGGAVNRIVEIECKDKLFDDPREVANTIRKNYGFAGKLFVTELQKGDNANKANQIYNQFYAKLSENDTTEKQSMAAAVILTADALATEWIFKDGKALNPDDISEFLQTKSSVSPNERAYEYICEYIVQNKNKFCGDSEISDVWGKIEDGQAYIVRNIFNSICENKSFNSISVLSWMRSNGKIEVSGKGFTQSKRINGEPCNCVILQLPQEETREFGYIDDLF